jgi:D-alanyl-D-alanine carboxypeptidase
MTSPDLAKGYVERINAPQKEFVMLPAGGHFAVFTHPEALLKEINSRTVSVAAAAIVYSTHPLSRNSDQQKATSMLQENRALTARLALALLLAFATPTIAGQTPQRPAAQLVSELNGLLSPRFPTDGPGAAVVVVKDGRVIFRKGYGMANLELKTPMQPDMVFEIGSITKQFTSTAILMLVEQGKLSLDDDLHKYLPDYPDKGAKISIENLLTHTSGIKSYTDDLKWQGTWRQDLTVQQIIDITKDDPLEFPPGSKWKYDNTGYILLGAIIEKVTGLSYADYVRKNIFEPLGMKHSYYGSNSAVIPGRASGYSRNGGNWVHATYLSMSQPYAAGALMSSVDDLAIWDAAVSAGKLLSKASWDHAFTPYKLIDGDDTHYGFGWSIEAYDGHSIVRHNGGIFGYVSEVARLPDDHVYVAMLTNSDAHDFDTGFLATELAAVAIGDPYREPVKVKLDPKEFDAFAGVYRNSDQTLGTVTREGDRFFAQRAGRPRLEMFAYSDHEFFLKDSFVRFAFEKDASGNVAALVIRRPNGARDRATRTNEPLPSAPVEIEVPSDLLRRYVGDYQLAPGFVLTVTLEGEQLMSQATGQQKVAIFPTSENEFFLKVVNAQISFTTDASGNVEKLVLHQGGRDMPGPKVK